MAARQVDYICLPQETAQDGPTPGCMGPAADLLLLNPDPKWAFSAHLSVCVLYRRLDGCCLAVQHWCRRVAGLPVDPTTRHVCAGEGGPSCGLMLPFFLLVEYRRRMPCRLLTLTVHELVCCNKLLSSSKLPESRLMLLLSLHE